MGVLQRTKEEPDQTLPRTDAEYRIGIVCCSNGQKRSNRETIKRLEMTLLKMGIHTSYSDCIYEREPRVGAGAGERAQALMDFYRDDRIQGIFDISGGDLANGILPYLDYEVIAGRPKTFWGGRRFDHCDQCSLCKDGQEFCIVPDPQSRL